MKVKIFTSNDYLALQNQINLFLEEVELFALPIQVTVTPYEPSRITPGPKLIFTACITYEEKDRG